MSKAQAEWAPRWQGSQFLLIDRGARLLMFLTTVTQWLDILGVTA